MVKPNGQSGLLLEKIAAVLRIDPKEFAQSDAPSEVLEAQAILLVRAFTRVSDHQLRQDCIRFVEDVADRNSSARQSG